MNPVLTSFYAISSATINGAAVKSIDVLPASGPSGSTDKETTAVNSPSISQTDNVS